MTGNDGIELGLQIAYVGGPLADMRRLWAFADESGFDAFSVSDHFREFPPRDGDGPCFESTAVLAAIAAETKHMRIGTMVTSVGYRNPGLTAKIFSTIDHLSGGRVECGLGAGWYAAEYAAFGIPFPPLRERFDQLEEYAQVLRLLFDPERDRVDFDGTYFRLEDAPNFPKPLQRTLPICIGGNGERRTIPIVARRADLWNGVYLSPERFRAKSEILDAACREHGRDPRGVRRTLGLGFFMGADDAGVARQDALLQESWGPRGPEYIASAGFLRGPVRDAVRTLEPYVDAGVDRIIVSVRNGPYEWDALEAFAAEVIPRLGRGRRAAP